MTTISGLTITSPVEYSTIYTDVDNTITWVCTVMNGGMMGGMMNDSKLSIGYYDEYDDEDFMELNVYKVDARDETFTIPANDMKIKSSSLYYINITATTVDVMPLKYAYTRMPITIVDPASPVLVNPGFN